MATDRRPQSASPNADVDHIAGRPDRDDGQPVRAVSVQSAAGEHERFLAQSDTRSGIERKCRRKNELSRYVINKLLTV